MEDRELIKNVLDNIEHLASRGVVSRDQVIDAFNRGSGDFSGASHVVERDVLKDKVTISDILYGLGALTVITGLVILVAQNWDVLNSFSRIFVTFGSAVAAYTVGLLFAKYENLKKVAQAFHIIGAVLMPIGLYVVFETMGMDTTTAGFQILMSSILFTIYSLSLYLFKEKVFLFFTLFFGTSLYYALISGLLEGIADYENFFNIYAYATLFAGVAYLYLARAFTQMEKMHFNGILNFFGSLFILGSAFSLMGDSILWEIIYPGLVIGMAFLSINQRSKAMLAWSSIFLMGYIMNITGKYFVEVIGWPLALVIAGLSLIGVGYYSYNISKKYII